MDRHLTGVLLTIVLALCIARFVTGGSPNCTNESGLVQLTPCMGFVSGQDPSPGSACCSAVEGFEAAEPVCFCELLGDGDHSWTIPSTINETLVHELPALCNAQISPAQCYALINGTASAPSTGGPTTGLLSGASPGPSSGASGISRALSTATLSNFLQFVAATAVASLLLMIT